MFRGSRTLLTALPAGAVNGSVAKTYVATGSLPAPATLRYAVLSRRRSSREGEVHGVGRAVGDRALGGPGRDPGGGPAPEAHLGSAAAVQYDATRIRGFSLTHMPGTGCAGGSDDIPRPFLLTDGSRTSGRTSRGDVNARHP
ncbi:hypothetical protein AVL59_11595 [Streptomyces griseochromogenes]|uniref:Uncharacterized protein n=1 Tax=Streptomyces griseochromogenes TaxID=68214 RepID=A0A1B1AUG9_9ACTN|nr:hypothetical protein AVL59_11595 [Streptomyces griseochromogenes]